MAKKYSTNKTKKTKEVGICEDCLRSPGDGDLKPEMFFWIQRKGYYSLSCIDCIEEFDHVVVKPYKKKRRRPKGSTNKKSDE